MIEPSNIKPIETIYRGYRFRSRLEARWAIFFQTLGVPWEYEPEGFRLSDGRFYLPDFRVKLAKYVLWAEVKPDGVYSDLFERFMDDLTAPMTRGTVLHKIPDPDGDSYLGPGDFDLWLGGGDMDNCEAYDFCVCGYCGAVGFEFEARASRIGCGCDHIGDYGLNDRERVMRAYRAARAARFEHGEQP